MSFFAWVAFAVLAFGGLYFGWHLPDFLKTLFVGIWGDPLKGTPSDILQFFSFFPSSRFVLAVLGATFGYFVAKKIYQLL